MTISESTHHSQAKQITLAIGHGWTTGGKQYHLRLAWRPEEDISAAPQAFSFLDGRNRGVDVWLREDADNVELWRPDFTLRLDLGEDRGEVLLARQEEWQNVLRTLYFFGLLSCQGLLLHASGLVRHGAAYIFPGPSGVAKTTIVRHSKGMAVLSDDLVAVQIVGNSPNVFLACGTPFYGDWGRPGEELTAPIKALIFPNHSQQNSLIPLSSKEVIRRLLGCVCSFTNWPPRLRQVLDLTLRLAESIPGFLLHFRPDYSFWELIDAHV